VAAFEAEDVLAPVAEESPCGENLEYDPEYMEVVRLAHGTPERQIGDSVIAAEEPDWRDIQRRAVALFARTKDLQIGFLLTLASLRADGLPGLASGLGVLAGLIERYWDEVHPRLDPEDDLDPTQRVMILDALAKPPGTFGDPWRVLERIRDCPLTNSRQLGRFSLRQILQAEGELPPPTGQEPPSSAMIDGAFQDTPLDELRSLHASATEASVLAERIESMLTERIGAGAATDLSPLPKAVGRISQRLGAELARRGASVEQAEAGISGDGDAPGADPDGGVGPGRSMPSGEITDRQGVLLALEKICRYYERHEPSSPVPMILKRAERLVSMPFMDIIRDLSPESLERIRMIAGTEESAEG